MQMNHMPRKSGFVKVVLAFHKRSVQDGKWNSTAASLSGLSLWTCDMCSLKGPCTQKGLPLGIMLCSCWYDIHNFSFKLRFCKWRLMGQWSRWVNGGNTAGSSTHAQRSKPRERTATARPTAGLAWWCSLACQGWCAVLQSPKGVARLGPSVDNDGSSNSRNSDGNGHGPWREGLWMAQHRDLWWEVSLPVHSQSPAWEYRVLPTFIHRGCVPRPPVDLKSRIEPNPTYTGFPVHTDLQWSFICKLGTVRDWQQ